MGTVRPAVEPPPSRWAFPDGPEALATTALAGGNRLSEVIGVGADLEPGTLLAAYRAGVFPMPARRGIVAWWSPDPRGIIPLDGEGPPVSRSLRRSCRRFELRVNTAFHEVIAGCANRDRPGAWIDKDIIRAYTQLHELGWVHSVETWDDAGRLAGGLYGMAVNGLFAGESMFHRETDASKVALVGLVEMLRSCPGEGRLLDVQWATPHLCTLGAVGVSRYRYHQLLERALQLPQPTAFGGG